MSTELTKYIHTINYFGRQYVSAALEGTGIVGSQHRYIGVICRNPGISQEALSKAVNANKSSVARQLLSLEENGFVERRICSSDRRVTQVYPTEKALKVSETVREVLSRWNDTVTDGLSPEELSALESGLEKLSEKARSVLENRA
jgi:DNA-binding MarR family transcriptional regulator